MTVSQSSPSNKGRMISQFWELRRTSHLDWTTIQDMTKTSPKNRMTAVGLILTILMAMKGCIWWGYSCEMAWGTSCSVTWREGLRWKDFNGAADRLDLIHYKCNNNISLSSKVFHWTEGNSWWKIQILIEKVNFIMLCLRYPRAFDAMLIIWLVVIRLEWMMMMWLVTAICDLCVL